MSENGSIRSLEQYSEADRNAARTWPAVARYLDLLNRRVSNANEDSAEKDLKLRRHRAWLECALALFHNTASDEDICRYWSDCADHHIAEAAQIAELDGESIVILGLGKLGARELNLSSDIDLIIVAHQRNDELMKRMRRFLHLIGQADEFGFCHRVDLDLRPGGKSSPFVVTAAEFESHYGYHAEIWERLALVRLRAVWGSSSLATELRSFAQRISYRRHLDYTVFDELRLLLTRIRNENPISTLPGFHLKLQSGGIRDIELLIHALQVIHGGRNRQLQSGSTTRAAQSLAEAGLLTPSESETLIRTYWRYRALENRLQAQDDQQTYRLVDPADVAEVRSLAETVNKISIASFPKAESAPEISLDRLTELGFDRAQAQTALDELSQSSARSRKSERDEGERRVFLQNFFASLQASNGDRDLALRQLVDFTRASRAKASLFSLLNREPQLLRQVATLFSYSPWAGQILSSRPELLDGFLLRRTVELPTEVSEEFFESLSERRLLGELVATLHFLETRDLDQLCGNLSRLADGIVADLMAALAKEHGEEPLIVFGLGKWGGNELGVRSDLDFVFATSTAPTANQQKLARRFLNRITEAHRGGAIYSVDLRLRPSGNAGPILISMTALTEYLAERAEAWERQSWLRSRPVISGSITPGQLQAIVLNRPWSKSDSEQTEMIASKLFKPWPSDGATGSHSAVDLKLTHGGLAPIEFKAQTSLLKLGPLAGATLVTSTHDMIQFLEEHSVGWKQNGPRLRDIHRYLRTVEQAHRISGDTSGSKITFGATSTSSDSTSSTEFLRLSRILELGLEAQSEKSMRFGVSELRTLFEESNQILSSL